MPTPTTDAQTASTQNGGLGGAAKSVAEHASSIARLELELAGLELKAKVTALVKVNNLLNKDIQQHVFGDIIKRSVVGELRLEY